MRYTRTQLSRLFVNLAMLSLPDGIPGPYSHLVTAAMHLKDECEDQRGGSEKRDPDLRALLTVLAGFQFALAVGFVILSFKADPPWMVLACILGLFYAIGTGIYFLREGR